MLSKQQEYELIANLSGLGEIPLKFAYLDDGAQNWLNYLQNSLKEEDSIFKREQSLLNFRINNLFRDIDPRKPINIIDIGCGDGKAIFPIADYLAKKEISFRYVPIDISQNLINVAEQNFRQAFPNIPFKTFLLNLENSIFSNVVYELKEGIYDNLLCFLGNTLGNFRDCSRVLLNFRDAMTDKDKLLIGNGLINMNRVEKTMRSYDPQVEQTQNADRTVEYYYYESVRNLVTHTAYKLGFNPENSVYKVFWNESKNTIIFQLNLSSDVTVKFDSREYLFRNGEKITIGRSGKFTEPSLIETMNQVGFRTEFFTTNKTRDYALILVQSSRF
jgi:uncharacterized SAM-dependent methyltransferase